MLTAEGTDTRVKTGKGGKRGKPGQDVGAVKAKPYSGTIRQKQADYPGCKTLPSSSWRVKGAYVEPGKPPKNYGILSCVAVIMQQKQAEHHAEALELVDCFYQSSHTYDYTESPLYSCDFGCEMTQYFCNEAEEEYITTEMKFAPYLHGELVIPEESHQCEVDRENPEMKFSDYAGCVVTGTCFHNSGDEEDNFGRRKPQKSKCSNPEAFWNCKHSCTKPECTHDCSRSSLGCGGYWYCGGHDHFGCPDGHEVKTCFGHVNMEINIHMKTMEELFALGGVEVNENGAGTKNLEGNRGIDADTDTSSKAYDASE